MFASRTVLCSINSNEACLAAPAYTYNTNIHVCDACHPNKSPPTLLVCTPSPFVSLAPKSMNTKLSQIEKSIKLKYRLDKDGDHGGHGRGGSTRAQTAGVDGGGLGHPRNRENEQLVAELHRYNGVLLRENSDLKTKIKVVNITMGCSAAIKLRRMRRRDDDPIKRMGIEKLAQKHPDSSPTLHPMTQKYKNRTFEFHPSSANSCRHSASTTTLHAAFTYRP